MSAPAEADAETIVGTTAPDYRFTFEPYPHRVRAVVGDVTVADSDAVMVLNETRLAPVFYFPRRHVRMDLMRATSHHTYCPFKGTASYWSLQLPDREIQNLMWAYPDPLPEARALGDYVAFYPELVDAWYEDERLLDASTPSDTQAYRNPLLAWLLHDAPAIETARELTDALSQRMLAVGIPLWRLNVIIRTLHPQLMAVSYRWWRKNEQAEEQFVSYDTMRLPRYLNSPLVPIFEGAGGIRRRLDIESPNLDFPILEELRGEGGTDYVAMPLVFSDGQINTVTLASARPGGFKTRDLGYVYEILDVLARLYEVHALRYRAATLLETYLGEHAGERVLDGVIKRGDGEDIHAVIWFCDLRESTVLAESMSRGEFLSVLNAFFDCMAGAVLDRGGQVLRFIGDAALAIFPIVASDDALADASYCEAYGNALAAALDARDRMRATNDARRASGLAPLDYGIALHPGEMTYGNIGTQNRLEFTVIGEACNRAARIEAMCKALGHRVLASGEFARHFPQHFESLGRHRLRGVEQATELFGLTDR